MTEQPLEHNSGYVPLTPDHQKKVMKNFGIWCQGRRKEMPGHPTQQMIADAAGLTRSHYCQIELGTHGTSPDSAAAIARALGYTSDDDVSFAVQLAGHGDPRQIPVVLIDITKHSGKRGPVVAVGPAGQPVELSPAFLEAVVRSVRESIVSTDDVKAELIEIQSEVNRTSERLDQQETILDRLDRNMQLIVEQFKPRPR